MAVSKFIWGLPLAIALFAVSWVVTGTLGGLLKTISVAFLIVVVVALIAHVKR